MGVWQGLRESSSHRRPLKIRWPRCTAIALESSTVCASCRSSVSSSCCGRSLKQLVRSSRCCWQLARSLSSSCRLESAGAAPSGTVLLHACAAAAGETPAVLKLRLPCGHRGGVIDVAHLQSQQLLATAQEAWLCVALHAWCYVNNRIANQQSLQRQGLCAEE